MTGTHYRVNQMKVYINSGGAQNTANDFCKMAGTKQYAQLPYEMVTRSSATAERQRVSCTRLSRLAH